MEKMNKQKERILELLWKTETPISVRDISEKTGLKTRSANMHLLRLLKLGYVSKSKDGRFAIADSGKEAIGFPKIDEKFARKVLSKTTPEMAFQFYSGIDQPTGVYSNDLVDLCEKIKTLDSKPIEFHMARGDFETWISSLGDIELAKRLKLISETDLTGEILQEKLHKVIRSRCDELLSK